MDIDTSRGRRPRSTGRILRPLALVAIVLLTCGLLVSPALSAEVEPTLERVPVPSNVLAAAGDVVAYRAVGEEGTEWEAALSLEALEASAGSFESVRIQRTSVEGEVEWWDESVSGCGEPLYVPVRANDTLLVFAQLGGTVAATYQTLCEIDLTLPDRQFIPRICTQIYCSGELFRAGELGERVGGEVPVGDPDRMIGSAGAGPGGVPGGLPGGWGGGPGGLPPGGAQDLCEQCLQPTGGQTTIIDEPCITIPGGSPPPPPTTGDVVYVHQESSTAATQIYRMPAGGPPAVNLSNSIHSEWAPDVHHADARIVFTAAPAQNPNRLHIRQIDGSHFTSIPNTEMASYPRWSFGTYWGDPFVVYRRAMGGNSAIWRIDADGTDERQLTFPGSGETDEVADVMGAKDIVFSRLHRGEGQRDLYSQYMHDTRPSVRLSETPDRSESLPVISHDLSLIAYKVRDHATGQETIHVGTASWRELLPPIHVISMGPPTGRNITGLDFWPDDQGLYVSVEATNVPSSVNNHRQEIFSVDFAGNVQRMTVNQASDTYPSAVP